MSQVYEIELVYAHMEKLTKIQDSLEDEEPAESYEIRTSVMKLQCLRQCDIDTDNQKTKGTTGTCVCTHGSLLCDEGEERKGGL